MKHEPKGIDKVRELHTVAAQIAELTAAVADERQKWGAAVDVDLAELATDFASVYQEREQPDGSTKIILDDAPQATNAVRYKIEEMVPDDTVVIIIGYEIDLTGRKVRRIDYIGEYCDVKPGNALDNWDAASNTFIEPKKPSTNEDGRRYLVPRVILRVDDPNEEDGIEYAYIPIDKIIAMHFVQ